MVAAGQLRELFDIQAPITAVEDGDMSIGWVDLAIGTRGAFVSTTGREFLQQSQINSELTHLIRIRYVSWLLPTHRFVQGTRVFNIISVVDPKGGRRELQVSCKEEVV